jgi:hypothetical protein
VNEIPDEILMAFADGELDAAECARVEAYLRTSAEGVRRLEVFASTGRGLADLFEQPMHEPIPQLLIDAATAEKVSGLNQARRVTGQRLAQFWNRPVYMALAASVAIAAIGASGFWLRKGSTSADSNYGLAMPETGDKWAVEGLNSALETVASGTVVTQVIAGGAATIEPAFTFATSDDRYCRQYVITRSTEIAYGGVACRTTGGRWRVVAHEPFRPKARQDQQIVTAGKVSLPSIDAIVDHLIAGDALSADAERSVMTGGWRTTAN